MRPVAVLLVATCILLLSGCGKRDAAEMPPPPGWIGMEADLARTLAEQADFYVFKTPGDLPANLVWQHGEGVPEFANIHAPKGGTFTYFIQDFPRTLRVIGPDATGGIRPFLWDDVAMYPAHSHPNNPELLYPGLADEWAVDEENRTVYFRLSPQARWSDGHPITTADYVFSLYLYRSEYIREPWYNNFHTQTWERITVFDDLTFALTLRERRPDWVSRAAQGLHIWPKHAMSDFGPDFIERYQMRVLPTTSPYILKPSGIERGRSITFTRNDNWWARDRPFFRGRFNADRLRLVVIRDIDKAFESFLRADIDMFLPMTTVPRYWYDLLPDNHPDVQAGHIRKIKFFNRMPRPDWGIWMNRSKPLLDNQSIRLGIQYASNFEFVAQNFFRGDAVQMQTRSDGYTWRVHPTITARPFDPVRARRHFAEAGFTIQGPDGVLRNERGERLSFTLTTYAPTVRDVMAILRTEALKAGLELNLELLDGSTGWKKVQEKNHELALIALARGAEMFPRYWETYHGSNANRPQTNNMTNTAIPELDALIEAYDKAESMEEIRRLAEQIEQIIYDDAAWVPGWAFPFYRFAAWRWVRWPDDFNVMTSRSPDEAFTYWIDQDIQREVREARRAGRPSGPPEILTFDQYKDN